MILSTTFEPSGSESEAMLACSEHACKHMPRGPKRILVRLLPRKKFLLEWLSIISVKRNL